MRDDQPRSEADDPGESEGAGPETADASGGREPGPREEPEPTDEGEEWKFSLSDIEAREAEAEDDTEIEARDPEPNATRIVRGNPSAENALFVLVGILAMVAVLFRLVGAGFGV